jgi:hypothetical protein
MYYLCGTIRQVNKMKKLTKKTIECGQNVVVVEGSYRLPTMKVSPWYEPQTKLIGYSDIGSLNSEQTTIEVGEELTIIGLTKNGIRGVSYKRNLDNKIYSSYLGEFTTFIRLK